MKRILIGVIMVMTVLNFGGCFSNKSDTNSVVAKTIEWEKNDNGELEFYTNDTDYKNASYWFVLNSPYEDPMKSFEVYAKKVSGYKDGGYGIIFGVQDNSNFYRLLITETGFYQVSKKVQDENTVILNWNRGNNLQTGYGVYNKIKVTYNAGEFKIYFNDKFENNFTDYQFTKGKYGMYLGVFDENFPKESVDILFAR
ncbi:hypothetical protein [Haliovirga abyssi]|uniref:DUF1080 domain-containing protein n=1 Tax=Haliovirga abyssi TaxID=2996794 RepID=A0AAU9DFC8_9FUSO|nr:hypothetical protein [Haliovirga abyssi]BDU50077.1 hypothetical protein HLVA_06460 [Haliovirga abyssi]